MEPQQRRGIPPFSYTGYQTTNNNFIVPTGSDDAETQGACATDECIECKENIGNEKGKNIYYKSLAEFTTESWMRQRRFSRPKMLKTRCCLRQKRFTTQAVHGRSYSRQMLFTAEAVHYVAVQCSRQKLFTAEAVHDRNCSRKKLFTTEAAHDRSCLRQMLFTTNAVHGRSCSQQMLFIWNLLRQFHFNFRQLILAMPFAC